MLDLAQVFSNTLFGVSLVIAFIAWFLAFVGQILCEARFQSFTDSTGSIVGEQWFAIFLQLALIAAVVYVLATGSLAVHRYHLGIWVAIALVFAVLGASKSIYGQLVRRGASRAMGAGWLLLAMIDIFWLFFFSADESTPLFQTINGFSRGPALMNRRSMRGPAHGGQLRRSSSAQHMNGQEAGNQSYSQGGIGNGYGDFSKGQQSRVSHGSLHSNTSFNQGGLHVQTMQQQQPMNTTTGSIRSPTSATNDQNGLLASPQTMSPVGRARALYAYTASPDDPNELSFGKGEVLDVLDRSGKWWQARNNEGRIGIVPSNYLQEEAAAA